MIIGNKRSFINGTVPENELFAPLIGDEPVSFGDYVKANRIGMQCEKVPDKLTYIADGFAAIALNNAQPGEIVRCGYPGDHYVDESIINDSSTVGELFSYGALTAVISAPSIITVRRAFNNDARSIMVMKYTGNGNDTTPTITFVFRPTLLFFFPCKTGTEIAYSEYSSPLIFLDNTYASTVTSASTMYGTLNILNSTESDGLRRTTNIQYQLELPITQSIFNKSNKTHLVVGIYGELNTYDYK